MTTISSDSRKISRPLRQKFFPWIRSLAVVGILMVLLVLTGLGSFDDDQTSSHGLLEPREKSQEDQDRNKNETSDSSTPEIAEVLPRLLIFDVDSPEANRRMMGAGNLMNGLLAAQLLGLEFDRTVCVSWNQFLEAFDYATPEQALLCQQAWDRLDFSTVKILELWGSTADQKMDECVLFDTLASQEVPIVVFRGNTYPGWRTDIPLDLFHMHYTPKPALLENMPAAIPQVVIHLRAPDSPQDTKDRGCGGEMLHYLGELLKGSNHYVISNSVDYIDWMHDCCGWSFDTKWGAEKSIRHSALPLEWVKHTDRKGLFPGEGAVSVFDTEQNLKLWVDWYTLLKAPSTFHADSEFSRSAIHWKGSKLPTGADRHMQLRGVGDKSLRVRHTHSLGISGKVLHFDHTQFLEGASIIQQSQDMLKKPVHIPPLSQRKRVSVFFTGEMCMYLRFCKNPFPHRKKDDRKRHEILKAWRQGNHR